MERPFPGACARTASSSTRRLFENQPPLRNPAGGASLGAHSRRRRRMNCSISGPVVSLAPSSAFSACAPQNACSCFSQYSPSSSGLTQTRPDVSVPGHEPGAPPTCRLGARACWLGCGPPRAVICCRGCRAGIPDPFTGCCGMLSHSCVSACLRAWWRVHAGFGAPPLPCLHPAGGAGWFVSVTAAAPLCAGRHVWAA